MKRRKSKTSDLIVCDRCTDESACPEHQGFERVQVEVTSSIGMRWNPDGSAEESVNGGPWTERPDCDFGTPMGDLIIDPWVQEIVRGKQKNA